MNAAEIHDLLQQMSEAGEFSGTVLIRQGEKDLYAGAFGWANRAFRVPNTINTLFGHASVTKMFTAVAILQLVEEGRLSLASPVLERLELTGTAISRQVTVQHLLTHTSGIADYFEDDDSAALEQLLLSIPPQHLTTPAGFLPYFAHKQARFEPGARFEYNSAGYVLLGLVIEKVSGLPYFDYIRQMIFDRAGMIDADFIPFDVVRERVAEGYMAMTRADGSVTGWRRNIHSVPPCGSPDGGAFASAPAMIQFMRALREGRLISREMAARMRRPHVVVAPRINYGYGLWVVTNGDRLVRYGHTGEDPGVSARVMYYPEQEIDIAILGNQGAAAGKILAQLHQWITA